MPIGEPHIEVECDRCEEVSDPMDLTMLAGARSWDMRNIVPRLKREGWYINGEETVCPECMATEASEVPNGEQGGAA